MGAPSRPSLRLSGRQTVYQTLGRWFASSPPTYALATIVGYGYIVLLLFLYSTLLCPGLSNLQQLLPKHGYFYRRTHVSHMHLDRMRCLVSNQGTGSRLSGSLPDTIPLVVSPTTTANEILSQLASHGLIPLQMNSTTSPTHYLCTSGHHLQNFNGTRTISDLGAQAFSYLYLHLAILGGSTAEEAPSISETTELRRRKRVRKQSRLVADPDNVERDKIPGISHALLSTSGSPQTSPSLFAPSLPLPAALSLPEAIINDPLVQPGLPDFSNPHPLTTCKCPFIISDEFTEADDESDEGFYKDLGHLNAELPEEASLSKAADVHHFFDNPHTETDTTDGKRRVCKMHNCKLCKKQGGVKASFVTDVTTGWRHLASKHKGAYHKWCKDTSFLSMLREDIEARANAKKAVQATLDPHVQPLPICVAPYSDELMKETALNAIEEPAFVEMLNMAAHAKGAIKLPGRNITCQTIMKNIFCVTSDNASNNNTMIGELTQQLRAHYQIEMNNEESRIGCLAHIIDLAMQAVIAAQSHAPHYDPKKPETHSLGVLQQITNLWQLWGIHMHMRVVGANAISACAPAVPTSHTPGINPSTAFASLMVPMPQGPQGPQVDCCWVMQLWVPSLLPLLEFTCLLNQVVWQHHAVHLGQFVEPQAHEFKEPLGLMRSYPIGGEVLSCILHKETVWVSLMIYRNFSNFKPRVELHVQQPLLWDIIYARRSHIRPGGGSLCELQKLFAFVAHAP
ncbi:hypothetical protein CERSUDRAFT_74176 [Gelatoporia subvermispora B]|uniref:Uncharacterized protein n=1 Tax=Ceriporiopsis subvermispora (strain B) TaxID=914234 RepID=M2QYG8_CERS8|nr:hypothetical protein CERSUDRAFT_74176 [Gelatoporia subvermispora B]